MLSYLQVISLASRGGLSPVQMELTMPLNADSSAVPILNNFRRAADPYCGGVKDLIEDVALRTFTNDDILSQELSHRLQY